MKVLNPETLIEGLEGFVAAWVRFNLPSTTLIIMINIKSIIIIINTKSIIIMINTKSIIIMINTKSLIVIDQPGDFHPKQTIHPLLACAATFVSDGVFMVYHQIHHNHQVKNMTDETQYESLYVYNKTILEVEFYYNAM